MCTSAKRNCRTCCVSVALVSVFDGTTFPCDCTKLSAGVFYKVVYIGHTRDDSETVGRALRCYNYCFAWVHSSYRTSSTTQSAECSVDWCIVRWWRQENVCKKGWNCDILGAVAPYAARNNHTPLRGEQQATILWSAEMWEKRWILAEIYDILQNPIK